MSQLAIRLLPVGLGDCILIRFPDDSWAVVDCGPDEMAAQQALRLLNSSDFPTGPVRFVLVTHPDLDHFGGIRSLLLGCRRPIERFYHSGVRRKRRIGGSDSLAFLRAVEDFFGEDAQDRIEIAQVGDDIIGGQIKGLETTILHPSDTFVPKEPVRGGRQCNNSSIVLQITYYGVEVILPGDIEFGAWQHLTSQGGIGTPHVLKVSHHGASNGAPPPTFLDCESISEEKTRWALLSTPTTASDKPAAEVLRQFWRRPEWRTRCTGWSQHCSKNERVGYPVRPYDTRYPKSLREALDMSVRLGTFERFGAKQGCCLNNELTIWEDGVMQHAESRKDCDGWNES